MTPCRCGSGGGAEDGAEDSRAPRRSRSPPRARRNTLPRPLEGRGQNMPPSDVAIYFALGVQILAFAPLLLTPPLANECARPALLSLRSPTPPLP